MEPPNERHRSRDGAEGGVALTLTVAPAPACPRVCVKLQAAEASTSGGGFAVSRDVRIVQSDSLDQYIPRSNPPRGGLSLRSSIVVFLDLGTGTGNSWSLHLPSFFDGHDE
jgi:hypothetical protein